jgi:hypothetical protein
LHGIGTVTDESAVRPYYSHPKKSLSIAQKPTDRSAQRGGTIRLAVASFSSTITLALARITSLINSKLDDFFGLSEYDWTPVTREDMPSMYLYELVNWLTTVVDSLSIVDAYKDEAYRGAVKYIADCLMVASSFWTCFETPAHINVFRSSSLGKTSKF